MDILSNIFTPTSATGVIYYICLALVSVFLSGWALSGKLRSICEENNKKIEETMTLITKRVEKLEADSIRKDTYTEDINRVYIRLDDIQQAVREGFAAQTTRIDQLFANKSV